MVYSWESSPRLWSVLLLFNYSPCVLYLVDCLVPPHYSCDPHSLLDSPVYIYLSLCTYTGCQNVDHFLCRVPCTPDYWEIAEYTLCLDLWFLPAPSWSVCHICSFLLPFLCTSTTILASSLVPFHICLLVLTPDLVFDFSFVQCLCTAYLLITWLCKPWALKTMFFCIFPGLHLVSHPSVTYLI